MKKGGHCKRRTQPFLTSVIKSSLTYIQQMKTGLSEFICRKHLTRPGSRFTPAESCTDCQLEIQTNLHIHIQYAFAHTHTHTQNERQCCHFWLLLQMMNI